MFYKFVTVVKSHGVRVDENFAAPEGRTHGEFLPYLNRDSTGRPVIRIYHPDSERAPLPLADDAQGYWTAPTVERERQAFFTIVHEFGHFLSWRDDKAKWDLVHVAKVRSTNPVGVWFPELMSDDERKITFDEEMRAWGLGREHVPDELRDAYDARAERSLSDYRQAFFGSGDAFGPR